MAPIFKTPTQLLDKFPSPQVRRSSRPLAGQSGEDLGPVNYDGVKDMFVTIWREAVSKALTRLDQDDDTTLISADPSGSETIAAYLINLSAGRALVGGVFGRFAAEVDLDLLLIGVNLDGTAATAITVDGDALIVAIVAVVISGAVEIRAVFGDQENQSSEVAPTDADIVAALAAGKLGSVVGLEDADLTSALVIQTILVERDATDTMDYTHDDPATVDALAARRAAGTLGVPVS